MKGKEGKDMAIVKKSIFINAPVERVYKYARDPRKWSQWYANLSGPDKLSGEGEAGTVVELKMSLIGLHFPVTVEVVEDNLNPTGSGWVGNVKGPLAGKQVFTYIPKENGTEASVELEYTVPANFMGTIINTLIFEKIVENGLKHTLENLKIICEA
jgi:uncharacterized membrane protein